jgi:hypothetical protein
MRTHPTIMNELMVTLIARVSPVFRVGLESHFSIPFIVKTKNAATLTKEKASWLGEFTLDDKVVENSRKFPYDSNRWRPCGIKGINQVTLNKLFVSVTIKVPYGSPKLTGPITRIAIHTIVPIMIARFQLKPYKGIFPFGANIIERWFWNDLFEVENHLITRYISSKLIEFVNVTRNSQNIFTPIRHFHSSFGVLLSEHHQFSLVFFVLNIFNLKSKHS